MAETIIFTPLGLFDTQDTTGAHNVGVRKNGNLYRTPPNQLLKWIGNKQRFAATIARVFPLHFNTYFEPFIGSGAVLGALAPTKGVAGDILKPLIDMWNMVRTTPILLYQHYKVSWDAYIRNPQETYKQILASYNKKPNALDLVFISRSCYGGIIRFTKKNYMSTPIGPHKPIPPAVFKERLFLWRNRIKNTKFYHNSFQNTMSQAGKDDIVYCDPPYIDSQNILYGSQGFKLVELWGAIDRAKSKGAKVVLSIDGHKKSQSKLITLDVPEGLFQRELFIKGGPSMLRRLQKGGELMVGEDVHDRLLLTW